MRSPNINIALLQHHSMPGNVSGNLSKLSNYYHNTINKYPDLDLLVAGELALSGYTPLDELYKAEYLSQLQQAILTLAKLTSKQKAALIFSDAYLDTNGELYNTAYFLQNGSIAKIIKKQKLVDNDIFNETRYFTGGKNVNSFIELKEFKLAVVVCEDLWHKEVVDALLNSNVQGIISVNASPYYKNKLQQRLKVANYAAKSLNAPVIYANIVGGVDGVVFDGQSFVLNKNQEVVTKLSLAQEELSMVTLTQEGNIVSNIKNNSSGINLNNAVKKTNNLELSTDLAQEFYEVIQVGFKDFITDNNFKGVIIGVSGGIDSALSAVIAADTLGSNKVIAVSMPSLYTSSLSKTIITKLVANLGVKLHEVPITDIFKQYTDCNNFNLALSGNNNEIVQENLQSRIRGTILMGLANSYPGYVVLCNGNKSEMATGYFTLYGDSCGAFNLIKDLFKTEVFSLASWRNQNCSIHSKLNKLNLIPEDCITRAPSAELKHGQTDEAALLPYALLDEILQNIIEHNLSYKDLITKFSKKDVDLVLKLLKSSEYKRKQGVIGIKLKNKSFGKEWQFPITNGFKQ